MTVECAQAGLPELEKQFFPDEAPSQDADRMKEKLMAYLSTLQYNERVEAFFKCVREDQLKIVNAHITRLEQDDLKSCFFYCLQNTTEYSLDFVNTQIDKLKGHSLGIFLDECLENDQASPDFVNAHIGKVDVERLNEFKPNWGNKNDTFLSSLLRQCVIKGAGLDFVDTHINKLKGDNLADFLFRCISSGIRCNASRDLVKEQMKRIKIWDLEKEDFFTLLSFYAKEGDKDRIENYLVNLEGGKLCKALWWCACLRQNNPAYLIKSEHLLNQFSHLTTFFTAIGGTSRVLGILDATKTSLKDSESGIDIPLFFQDIQDLVKQDFKHKEARKQAKSLENKIQESDPATLKLDPEEAINLLDKMLQPMDFWALQAQIRYSAEEMEQKIQAHVALMTKETEALFKDKANRADLQKEEEKFLKGMEYVSAHLPNAYHVAVLDTLEETSRRLYVSNELQKILEHNKLWAQAEEEKPGFVSEQNIMQNSKEKAALIA